MIAALKPYPAMKDSGVRWLGELPQHWDVLRGRNLFEIKKRIAGQTGYPVFSVTQGGLRVRDVETGKGQVSQDYSKYQIVEAGDLAMNSMDLLTGGVGIADSFGVTSPDYRVFSIRDSDRVCAGYMLRVFRMLYQNKGFFAWGQGSAQLGRWRLPRKRFNEFPFPLPSLPEQAAIARFIDHADRKIRRYIRAKQKLIKLLEEQKQAIIHRAVTRGLDPDVRLKPSGVEWLGEVPAHWEVIRLKALATESVAGPYGSSLTKEMYTDSGYRVYGQQQVIPDDFSIGDYYISAEKYQQMKRYTVWPGDVLVSVMGTVGRVAVVTEDAEPGIINPRLVRYRPDFEKVRSRYLQLAMMGPSSGAQIIEGAKGTTMEGLNMKILGNLSLVIPPVPEQDAILASVNSSTAHVRKASDAASRSVTLLREYRTRLLADVVTGKLDVREAAARLPDKAEEPELEEEAHDVMKEEEDTVDLEAVLEEAEA